MQAPSRESYDVAVAGGGVIGLACAWRAAERGLSVVVLERGQAAAAASSVAAGMLAPVTETDFGEEAVLRLGLASRDLWPGFAAELEERSGLPTHIEESGALVVAAERDDVGELRRLNELQRELGWTPSGSARATAAGSSRGWPRGSPAACSRPATRTSPRERWRRRWPRRSSRPAASWLRKRRWPRSSARQSG